MPAASASTAVISIAISASGTVSAEPFQHQFGHRRAVGIAQLPRSPTSIPLTQLPVATASGWSMPELDGQRLHRIGRGVGAHQHLRGVARQDLQHQENDHGCAYQRRQQGQQTSEDKYAHARSDFRAHPLHDQHVRAPEASTLLTSALQTSPLRHVSHLSRASGTGGRATPRTARSRAASPHRRGSGRRVAIRSAGRRGRSRRAD